MTAEQDIVIEELRQYEDTESQLFRPEEIGWSDFGVLLTQAFPVYLRALRRGRRDYGQIIADFIHAPEGHKLEHVLTGLEFSRQMKRSDMAVNQFYWDFTHNGSKSGALLIEAMENPRKGDHNKNHIRRLEEWVEDGLNNTFDIRHGSWEYSFWLPSLYLAIKFHDFPQLLSGKKNAHPELAALWVMAAHHQIAQSLGIEKEHAWLLAKGAAIIILHHSHPEDLDDPLRTITNIAPDVLFTSLSDEDKRNLPIEFWKEHGSSIRRIGKLKKGLTAGFSSKDMLVIERYCKLLGWGDKADTAFPGDIGTERTFLAGPARMREIYNLKMLYSEEELIGVEDELDLIMQIKGGEVSDVWRKVYELTRSFTDGGSDHLGRVARHNMIVASRDAKQIFLRLMNGEIEAIDDVFSKRAWQLAEKLLRRKKVPLPMSIQVIQQGELADADRLLLRYLSDADYWRFKNALEAMAYEKEELYRALRMNERHHKVRKYPENERLRVGALFDLVITRLCALANVVPEETVMWEYYFPFTAYDSVAGPEEMQRAPYKEIQ